MAEEPSSPSPMRMQDVAEPADLGPRVGDSQELPTQIGQNG